MNKEHVEHGKTRRLLSVITAAALFVTSVGIPCNTRETEAASTMEAAEETTLSNPTTDSNGVTTWDCIYFGNYWQNDTNGDGTADQNDTKEPIKWRVLSVDGDDAFLLADQNLDCQPYDEEGNYITWETCTLRTWLNSTFLTNAFSTAEQEAISSQVVVNNDNPYYGTEGGNNTTDKVYLLSMEEACNTAYGFNGALGKYSETREAKNTAYANACGAYTEAETEYKGNGYWLLRSPGYQSDYAACVDSLDRGDFEGNLVGNDNSAVRPALHVNLSRLNLSSSTLWSYVGKVTSNEGGGTMPTVTPTPTFAPSFSGLVNPTTDSEDVTTWDCIYFGNYWQNDTNGDGTADQNDDKEPIKWRVLSVNGDDAFILADQNLDYQPYNEEDEAVTWETCTLRTWLNDTFLANAFSEEEQAVIEDTTVVNEDNPYFGTGGGNNTTDQVYLLSMAEACSKAYGFDWAFCNYSETREAKNTAYAKACGAYTETITEYEGNGEWWLRSPGSHSRYAAYVRYYGRGRLNGDYVYDSYDAVRPALHVNLSRLNLSSSTLWSYAGKVTSKEGGGATQTPAPTETTSSAVPTINPTGTPSAAAPTAVPTIAPAPVATQTSGQPQSTSSTFAPTISPTDMPTPTADTVTETVAVPSVQLKSLKASGKGKVKATWKKPSEVSGYRLQYAQDKKFKKNAKTKWLTAKKKSVTLTGLKKKKTYYVRICAYLFSDGKKVYGKWSNVKKVKIKK